MGLILDNNIFFSLMNPNSTASYLFFSIRTEFFAPEFIKSELKEHKEECLIKSKLSEHEFEIRQKEVEEPIKFFKSSEYTEFLREAKASLSDPDDIDFLALALSINSPIWSNDLHFKKQRLAKVFTTEELFNKMLKNEI
ncbi:MAG: PIN domain-containing protein [Nanoarchaeota archaeon]